MAINASRRAQIELGLDPKGLDAGLAAARAKLRGFQDRLSKGIQRKGGAMASGIVGGLVGGVTGAVTNRVLGMVEGTAEEVLTVERALTRLQIAGGQSATELAKVRQTLNEVSRTSGIARSEILSGSSTYLALTGDVVGATQSMELFATVANASGSGMADIASTAASMKDNLKIDPRDFEKGFDILISQGKAGAVELNELATLLAGLAPSFAQFKGGSGIGGMADLGAAFQASRKGFGSAAEAATGVRALMVAINRSAGKFEKAGVKIFKKNPRTGKKELQGFLEIVDAIGRSKLANDGTLLTKAFGSDEAKRAYDQLILNRNLVQELRENAGGGAVSKDSAAYLASTAGKIEVAMNAAKIALVEAFSPQRIAMFAAALGKAAEVFAKIVHYAERIMGIADEQKTIADYKRREDVLRARALGLKGDTDADLWHGRRAKLTSDQNAEVNRQLLLENRIGYMMESPVEGNAYNLAELGRLAEWVKTTSDPERLARINAEAIARETKKIVDTIRGTTTTVVQFGTESVNRASQDAKSHRGRPGGR
jgi:TP901 family phage tail tape measure protein